MSIKNIKLTNIGQIKQADISFGDLTVLVGPQATGKSIFLQLLKLVLDRAAIQEELHRNNLEWKNKPENFLELIFGDGMGGLWDKSSTLTVDDKEQVLADFWKPVKRGIKGQRLFLMPAQRVLSLRDGQTRPFSDYRAGDPFAVRNFSEQLHQLVQTEFGQDPALFPQKNRMKAALRTLVDRNIFGGYGLRTGTDKFQKRLVLEKPGSDKQLSYLVWSAGQREFVPLLLGLYWLMPAGAVETRSPNEWVVIEELEMGLHPSAISTTMALVLELLRRGYKVCLSTHSPHVLDVVWGLQFLQSHGGTAKDVLRIFDLAATPGTKEIAVAALKKKFRTYYFDRSGIVKDISALDPGADDDATSGWGGLSEFSGRVAQIVSEVARRKAAGVDA